MSVPLTRGADPSTSIHIGGARVRRHRHQWRRPSDERRLWCASPWRCRQCPQRQQGRGGSVRVAAADAVGLVVSPAADGEETLLPDDPREAAAVESAFAVAPSLAATSTSGEGGAASVPAADAAVVAALSATLRRMYERKEDMRPAVGGGESEPDPCPPPCQRRPEVAVAVAPATASTVASREGEAARIVAVEVTGTVTSPAASEGTVEKWEAELPPLPVSR